MEKESTGESLPQMGQGGRTLGRKSADQSTHGVMVRGRIVCASGAARMLQVLAVIEWLCGKEEAARPDHESRNPPPRRKEKRGAAQGAGPIRGRRCRRLQSRVHQSEAMFGRQWACARIGQQPRLPPQTQHGEDRGLSVHDVCRTGRAIHRRGARTLEDRR